MRIKRPFSPKQFFAILCSLLLTMQFAAGIASATPVRKLCLSATPAATLPACCRHGLMPGCCKARAVSANKECDTASKGCSCQLRSAGERAVLPSKAAALTQALSIVAAQPPPKPSISATLAEDSVPLATDSSPPPRLCTADVFGRAPPVE